MTHIPLEPSPISCLQVAFPKVKAECVDLELMVERHREEVDEMKALFGYHYPEGTVIEVVQLTSQIHSQNFFFSQYNVLPPVKRWRSHHVANLEVHQGLVLHRASAPQRASTGLGETHHARHRPRVQVRFRENCIQRFSFSLKD